MGTTGTEGNPVGGPRRSDLPGAPEATLAADLPVSVPARPASPGTPFQSGDLGQDEHHRRPEPSTVHEVRLEILPDTGSEAPGDEHLPPVLGAIKHLPEHPATCDQAIKFDNLHDLLPGGQTIALHPIDRRESCTHQQVKRFVAQFSFKGCMLRRRGDPPCPPTPAAPPNSIAAASSPEGSGSPHSSTGSSSPTPAPSGSSPNLDPPPAAGTRPFRIALALPPGPEMALALLATMAHATAVPINPHATRSEVESQLRRSEADALMVEARHMQTAKEAADTDLGRAALAVGIPLLLAMKSDTVCGEFALARIVPETPTEPMEKEVVEMVPSGSDQVPEWTKPSDTAVIFFTSGTSGTQKVVPYRLEQAVVGAVFIIKSWDLSPADVCINQMPYFHIGGVSRNVLSPVLSGGGVIVFTGYEPDGFWDVMEGPDRPLPTWYYSSPTFHAGFVQEAQKRKEERSERDGELNPRRTSTLRFIANAAGNLSQSLMDEMKEVFDCPILPSYGMTEAMPITATPLDYNNDRPCSSGMACGPQVKILDRESLDKEVPVGTQGVICVRGCMVLDGYENDQAANDVAFRTLPGGSGGWFNTGDLGMLDGEGYLYIQGRTKEVINRGGEIISPFDIEEALGIHPDLSEVLCFSAPHDLLQETVGVAVVVREGRPRPALGALQKFVQESLQHNKHPEMVVYMTDFPRTDNKKPQRIDFATRAKIPEISSSTPDHERMLEAEAPPAGAPVSRAFGHNQVELRLEHIARRVEEIGAPHGVRSAVAVLQDRGSVAGQKALVAYVAGETGAEGSMDELKGAVDAQAQADASLQGYELPEFIFTVEEDAVEAAKRGDTSGLPTLRDARARNFNPARSQVETIIADLWVKVLEVDPADITPNANWWMIGGDSFRAAQLVREIKATYNNLRLPLSNGDLVTYPTVEKLAKHVAEAQTAAGSYLGTAYRDAISFLYRRNSSASGDQTEDRKVYRSGAMCPLVVQSLPLLVIAPFRRMLVWFSFVQVWAWFYSSVHSGSDLENTGSTSSARHFFLRSLFLTIATIKIVSPAIMPFLGIAVKWALVQRYRTGLYPLWGHHYLRWWLSQQVLAICGKGWFAEWPWSMRLYYILLGAKIGKGVSISPKAKIGEFDLLEIGEGTVIDGKSYVRPFALDRGRMTLQPIKIGRHCSLGVNSTVHPGATMPDGTNIGPLSSTYEMDAAHVDNLKSCRPSFVAPRWGWRLLGHFLVGFVGLAGWLPVLGMLTILGTTSFYKERELSSDPRDILQWFSTRERMAFYVAIKAVRAILCPWFRFWSIVLVKKLFIGKFKEGPRDVSGGWGSCRHWIMQKLLPDGTLSGVTPLLGRHYDSVSWCMRRLGAKVGKRVYWPGSGLECAEHDLLTVGDDVVFGSRSLAMPCDAEEAKAITIGAGCFVADRCVILPGATMGINACLGSGCLAAGTNGLEDSSQPSSAFFAPPGSQWVGSKEREAVNLKTGDVRAALKPTVRPFGRAFHGHGGFKAPYTVFPEWFVVFYHHLWHAICAALKALPLVGAVWGCRSYFKDSYDEGSFVAAAFVISFLYLVLHAILNVVSLFFCIMAKWWLLGQRTTGDHFWDQDSYNQRWQMYLCIEELRRCTVFGKRGILDLLGGSEHINTYFRLLGAEIGPSCCLYPCGGDPMMTEPDLVTIASGVSVDDASVVCHVNLFGDFSLNSLYIGDDATLRSFSRLMSGASMAPRARLLEHTLIVSGGIIVSGQTIQGWPGHHVAFDLKEIDSVGVEQANKMIARFSNESMRSPPGRAAGSLSAGGPSTSRSAQPDPQGGAAGSLSAGGASTSAQPDPQGDSKKMMQQLPTLEVLGENSSLSEGDAHEDETPTSAYDWSREKGKGRCGPFWPFKT